MVCLGSKPGPQDGRRRQNHGAMAATQIVCKTYFTLTDRPTDRAATNWDKI